MLHRLARAVLTQNFIVSATDILLIIVSHVALQIGTKPLIMTGLENRQAYMQHRLSNYTAQEMDFQLFTGQSQSTNVSTPYSNNNNIQFYSEDINDYFSQPTLPRVSPDPFNSFTSFPAFPSGTHSPDMYPSVSSPGFTSGSMPYRSASTTSLSATSSVVGSPYMVTPGIPAVHQSHIYSQQSPAIVDYDNYGAHQEYKFPTSETENNDYTFGQVKPMFTGKKF